MMAGTNLTVQVELSKERRVIVIDGESLDILFDDDPRFAAFCDRLELIAIRHLESCASDDERVRAREELMGALEKVAMISCLKSSIEESRKQREEAAARRSQMLELRNELICTGRAKSDEVDAVAYRMWADAFGTIKRRFPHLHRLDFASVSGMLLIS